MYFFFLKLSRAMAYLGGTMLVALVLLTGISVLGRAINSMMYAAFMQDNAPGIAAWVLGSGVGPINGDFELIEAGIAFSIFAFLPLCQITGGHATVDVFTGRLSPAANRVLQLIIDLVFAGAMVVIATQLYAGTLSKFTSGQVTFLLQFPLWWAYALSLSGAIMAAIVSVFIALARVLEFITRYKVLPENLGADH